MADFIEKLRDDLIEQFKEKPVIDCLMQAIGIQLNDVFQFYADLAAQRSVFTAHGQQLDGVGDIVCLTRKEAGELACINEPIFYLDDEVYRDYLVYKIWKNTNNCTYYDIMRALRMFWDKPLYYEENPAEPATFMWVIPTESQGRDSDIISRFPMVRAAGVGTKFIIQCNIGIIINTAADGHPYSSTWSGRHECGTVPWRNKRGGGAHTSIIVTPTADGHSYRSPESGTQPWRSTVGRKAEDEIEIEPEDMWKTYRSRMSGRDESGIIPNRRMKGAYEHEELEVDSAAAGLGYSVPVAGTQPWRSVVPGESAEDLTIDETAQGHSYRSSFAGRVESGTEPYRTTPAINREDQLQVEAGAERFQYRVPVAGQQESGTKPVRSTDGIPLDGAFFAEAEGKAFHYRVKWCGRSYCKS